jgi:hypothetical protein
MCAESDKEIRRDDDFWPSCAALTAPLADTEPRSRVEGAACVHACGAEPIEMRTFQASCEDEGLNMTLHVRETWASTSGTNSPMGVIDTMRLLGDT